VRGSTVYAVAMFMFILGWIIGYLTKTERVSREKGDGK